MAWDEERIEEFKRHILQPNDTFTFSCDMCGNCCRNRDEPILMTGADIFRIAKGLGISTLEVLFKHTRGYIGDTTHLPVAVLKERLDGSCSFLRKGKCTIQAFKPTPCALYPLGRMYDERDKKFYYFNQPYSCGKSGESGRVWTLQEWIDEFHLEDYLDDVAAWNKLVVGLAMITKDIPEEKLDQSLAKVVMFGLYGDYDTSKPYQEEVQKNMVQLKAMLKDGFNLHVDFEEGAGV